MNPYAVIGSAMLIVAVITGAYFEGKSAGAAACTVRDQVNVIAADKQQRTAAAAQASKDNAGQVHLARGIEQTASNTTNLSEALHAPQPVPAAATRLIPNPFPPGFSLCWNAASSRDPATVAACQARRRSAAMPDASPATTRHGRPTGVGAGGHRAPDPGPGAGHLAGGD